MNAGRGTQEYGQWIEMLAAHMEPVKEEVRQLGVTGFLDLLDEMFGLDMMRKEYERMESEIVGAYVDSLR